MIADGRLLRRCATLVAGAVALGSVQALSRPPPHATAEQASERQFLIMLRHPPDRRPRGAYDRNYDDRLANTARRRVAQNIARRHRLGFVGNGLQMPLLGVDCYVMKADPGETIENAMERIAGDPEILWSEPMHIYWAQGSRTAPA